MKKVLIFLSIFMISVSIYMLVNHYNKTSNVTIFSEKIVAPTREVIDKDLIVLALTKKSEIVGLEGNFNKEYEYKEQTISSSIKFIQKAGERTFSIVLNGTFKMGFDLSEIKTDHIFVVGNTVKIITPPPKLISFEAPYHLMEIQKHKGFLVKDFSEDDRKTIYENAYESAVDEVLSNKSIHNEAVLATRNAIETLLLSINLIESVEFINIYESGD